MGDLNTPLISISIVNLDGKKYLADCLRSIQDLSYPSGSIEVILVDNGSKDGSVELVKKDFSFVKVIQNDRNNGFAPANNQAARVAKGEYIAFLNNDTRVDKNWLKELIRPIYKDRSIICSGSKVLSMDGKALDFVGGMVNFEGKGFQIDYGLDITQDSYDMHRFSPFVNGGSMLIDRNVFLDVGGFDEDFFAYYEDVDIGWRLWVLGYKVLFCPQSIVYHAHHGTSDRFSQEDLRFLKERNSLIMVYKNYEDKNLPETLELSLLSLYNRVFVDHDPLGSETGIKRWPASSIAAYRDFIDKIDRHKKKRDFIQENRKRPDSQVFSYFKGWYLSSSSAAGYQTEQAGLIGSSGIEKIFKKPLEKTLLMITDGSSEDMLCRYLCIARVLSEYMEIVLAIPEGVEVYSEFEITRFDDLNISSLVDSSDMIYTDHRILSRYGFLRDSRQHIMIDCSEVYPETTSKDESLAINESFYYGDLFITSSEKQKNGIIGMLSALGRINPYIFIEDPSLEKLVCNIPPAVPSNAPLVIEDILAGIDGLSPKDKIIIDFAPKDNLASGDEFSLIDAVSETSGIKLLFLGYRGDTLREIKEYVQRLGMPKERVFFVEKVLKQCDMADYLSVADLAFIGRGKHTEQFISILWAGIPVIALGENEISYLISEKNLGKISTRLDLKDDITSVLQDGALRRSYIKNIKEYNRHTNWEEIVRPILDFCINPVARAKRDRVATHIPDSDLRQITKSEPGYIRKFIYHLRHSGIKKTLKYSANVLRGRK